MSQDADPDEMESEDHVWSDSGADASKSRIEETSERRPGDSDQDSDLGFRPRSKSRESGARSRSPSLESPQPDYEALEESGVREEVDEEEMHSDLGFLPRSRSESVQPDLDEDHFMDSDFEHFEDEDDDDAPTYATLHTRSNSMAPEGRPLSGMAYEMGAPLDLSEFKRPESSAEMSSEMGYADSMVPQCSTGEPESLSAIIKTHQESRPVEKSRPRPPAEKSKKSGLKLFKSPQKEKKPQEELAPVLYDTESGEDSNDDEETEAVEHKEGVVKGKLKPGKKATDTDMKPAEVTMIGNFYEKSGRIYLMIPTLPAVEPTVISDFEVRLDYEDFKDKMSLWYDRATKKCKQGKNDGVLADKGKAVFGNRRFECVRCHCFFESGTKWALHRAAHRNPGYFACQVCLTLFSQAYNLYGHWRGSCSGVAKSRSDNLMQGVNVPLLRNYVLCAMGGDNRGQQFHVFGGILFIPSEWFLSNKYNIIDPMTQTACHLCNLLVPTKFLECHGDVHRGRFRIDGKIYGDHFCHVCGMIFREKSNLITHWRLDCQEVMYYTPEDVQFSDEEIVALAWLILQTTIAQDKILMMAKNSTVALEKWAHNHAEKHEQLGLTHRYFHYPQEIWPLKLNTGGDVITDAIPIFGTKTFQRNVKGEMSLYNPDIPVHMTNLLATACPDFYATGAVFNEIIGENDRLKGCKSVYRVVLRYTTKGSIIGTYKISARTCPSLRQLRAGTTGKVSNQTADYNVEKKYVPVNVDDPRALSKNELRLLQQSWSCRARQDMVTQRKGASRSESRDLYCKICKKIYGMRDLREHYTFDCNPLKEIFKDDPETRMMVDQEVAQHLVNLFKKCGANVYFEYLRRPQEGEITDRQRVERIGEWHKYRFRCTQQALDVIRKQVERSMVNARKRFEDRQRLVDKFQPPYTDYVVCTHCGCRMEPTGLMNHLIYRHFFDEEAANYFSGQDEKGERISIHQTYEYVARLIKTEEKRMRTRMMPMMTKAKYENCCFIHREGLRTDFETCKQLECARGDFDPKYTFEDTQRRIQTDDLPLALTRKPCMADQILAPLFKMGDGYETYKPKAQIVTDTDRLKACARGDVWMPPNNRLKLAPLTAFDPKTNEPLEGRYAEIQLSQSETFFGAFCREAASNGIAHRSLAEYTMDKKTGERRGENAEADGDELFDNIDQLCEDAARFEFDDVPIESSDEDDEMLMGELSGDEEDGKKEKKTKHTINDDDQDADDMRKTGRRNDVVDPNEETAESVRKRLQRRKELKEQHKRMSETATRLARFAPPPAYNPEQFRALHFPIKPDKMHQLKFLTTVVVADGDEAAQPDLREDRKSIKALSMAFENVLSDFRESGKCFRKWYRKRMPQKAPPIPVAKLRSEHRRDAIRFEDLEIEGTGGVSAVMDRSGRLFLDGYVTAFSELDQFDNNQVVWIMKGDFARKFKVFNCQDRNGKFKFYWPYSKKSSQQLEHHSTLVRVALTEQKVFVAAFARESERRLGPNPSLERFKTYDQEPEFAALIPPAPNPLLLEQLDENNQVPPRWDSDEDDQDFVEPPKKRRKMSEKKKKNEKEYYDEDEDSDDVDDKEMILYSSDEMSSIESEADDEFEDDGPSTSAAKAPPKKRRKLK